MTDLDNLSKKPFFFLTDSFGVESGVVSGDRNASSSDEMEEYLVCLPIEGPWQWPKNFPTWSEKHLCIPIRVCFLREFFPTTINKEIRVKRTSFSQGLRSGSYLRPEWSRKIRPGGRGPPSARGMRFGIYLRLEWSWNNNHKITTLICLHFMRGLSLNY